MELSLASAVPAGIHQVGAGSVGFHLYQQLLCILCGVQGQERCAKVMTKRSGSALVIPRSVPASLAGRA